MSEDLSPTAGDDVNAPNKLGGLADDDNDGLDADNGLDAEKAGPQIRPDMPDDEQPPKPDDDPNALPNR